MLQTLQIENYALIRSLEISFDQGFTVITGETGAGKSILMGALSLILGNRADTDVLYDKSRKCIVEGTFDLSSIPLHSFFEQNDLDFQETTTIRREINEHGKSRAFINDTPVNLSTLKTLASMLIDIHSQHQHLLFQNSDFRLNILDQYARNQDILAHYKEAYAQWKQAEDDYAELKRQCAEAALQQDFNNFTIQELEQAHLEPDEQETAEDAVKLLSHAESIKAHLYQASQYLSESDSDTILHLLKSVQNECDAIKDINHDYLELYNRVAASLVELKDIAYEIAAKEQSADINPQELEQLNERLDLIYTLQHKYHVDSVQELLDILAKLRAEADKYTDNQEQLAELDKKKNELHAQVRDLAGKLRNSRESVVPALQQEMEARLQKLALPDSRFLVRVVPDENLHPWGAESAEFLFSANKGVEPADLSKVASGGEMSRVMLAVKSIITDSMVLPTVIFDEIDTGISGETAHRVAEVMGDFAKRHQVIAITHLPQIAAYGNQQYLVFKENIDNHAVTMLKELAFAERVQAIATLICGNKPTEAALNTARELLSAHTPTKS